MNQFDAFMAQGMGVANNVLGEPITIDGKPYTGTVNAFRLERTMAEAGFDPNFSLTAVIPLSQMPVAPPHDTRAVFGLYKGRKVEVKDSDSDSAAITLYLKDVK